MIADTKLARLFWIALLVLPPLLVLLLNPLGYLGGGMDDDKYLGAAECWIANNAPCLPTNHWEGRWPVFAPMAALIELFGTHRWTIGLPSLAYGAGCAALIAHLGNRLAGAPVGWAAAALWALVPTLGLRWLHPNVDFPEAFFALSAAAFTFHYTQHRDWRLAAGAGLALALAIQSRETAIAYVPIFAFVGWKVAARDWRAIGAALVFFALPGIVEMAWMWAETGDPLYRRMQAIGHANTQQGNLTVDAGGKGLPFFNPAYIANWNFAAGIDLHWTVNGIVNFIFAPLSGTLVIATLVLTPLAWPRLDAGERLLVKWAAGISAFWLFAMIYALAVLPNPRMMMPVLIACAFVLALALRGLERRGMALLARVVVGLTVVVGIFWVMMRPSMISGEDWVRAQLDRYPGEVAASASVRRQLVAFDRVDEFAPVAVAPLVIVQTGGDCEAWRQARFPDALSLRAERSINRWADRTGRDGAALCLLENHGRVSGAMLDANRTGY